MNYEMIKQLAKEMGCKVTDLIPLAPQNDPFYTGTPTDWAVAEWFAQLWQQFGYRDKVHIRRVHYQIVSQRTPVLMPNSKPYENTSECWDMLNMASKAARYLQLVNPAAFSDRRNDDPVIFAAASASSPHIRVYGNLWQSSLDLPDFPEVPEYGTGGFTAHQRYHIEVWCEKSTMNDVLLPLCQRYGANLQTGSGELSITATLALADRLREVNKPARIFYVSDFDPAGQSMPVAVSRKMEYFLRTLGLEVDVRLFPVILTAEQVRYFHLPRTPIKETERRRVGFEERYGEGAVELDALEALYPGKLAEVLRQHMDSYYDSDLHERVQMAEAVVRTGSDTVADGVLGSYESDVEALHLEHERLRREFAGRMEDYGRRLSALWQAIRDHLRANMPHLEDYPVPEAEQAWEIGDGLFNSERDYLSQVAVYKAFQGKLVAVD